MHFLGAGRMQSGKMEIAKMEDRLIWSPGGTAAASSSVPLSQRTSENRKARECAVPSKNSRLSANQFEARCARSIDILGADRDIPDPLAPF
jgi:hypothetical protein